MKYKILSIFLLYLVQLLPLSAQKHDYNWIIGREYITKDTVNRNGLLLDFDGSEVNATIFDKEQWFFLTNLSYSDAEGKLQLYSDGCALYNEEGVLLENGDNIHDDSFCESEPRTGYPASQGIIALPTSDKDIIALFYHEQYIVNDSLGVRIEVRIHRAIIDIKEDIVISKKEVVLDSLAGNTLSATKHTNGQDWWIISQDYFTNEYKCLLISEGEVLDTVSSYVGNPVINADAFQSNFSPNGESFARFAPEEELQIFDFNRSLGTLSNFRLIEVPNDTINNDASGGLSFSGSSRFLYVNDALAVWQLDMQAPDLAASMVQVAQRDTFFTGLDIFNFPIPTFFYRQALAPDCRIYMSSRNGVDRIHTIMEPELKGAACDVVQNIKIPVWNSLTTPHFPNYRLDSAPFCDSSKAFPSNLMTTVSTVETPPARKDRLHLFPNPASDYIQVYCKHFIGLDRVQFVLHDLLGRAVFTAQVALANGATNERLDISTVPAGLYVYSVLDEQGNIIGSDRVVIK
jgi:hypothetical protein